MTTVDALLVDALYADPYLSVPAEYTPAGGDPVQIRVLDRTQGVVLGDGPQQSTVTPVAHVRRGDVAQPPTDGALRIPAATGALWRIMSWRPKLNGHGTATGELILTLQKA